MQATLQERSGPLRGWLLGQVCPFWFDRVLDPAGGFLEALDASSLPLVSPERSILNQARLTYVASHAFLLGGDETMRHAAAHGFAMIRKALGSAGPSMGWPRRFLANGTVLDGTRDAYDHAFVIFAMAWYYRATGNPEALELAGHAHDFMRQYLADPAHGGFFEEYPATGRLPRRQNPHMHLLEAVLAMHEATGEPRWLDQAQSLVDLFERKFLDRDSGSLIEFFTEDWRPADDAAGALREPGHQFEWVWLLGQYVRLSGRGRLTVLADGLFAFGSRFGIDAQDALGGAVFDGVGSDGAIVADSKLFWPQTEYIKACVQKYEASGDGAFLAAATAHIELLQRHFFRTDGGNWCNQLSRSGAPLVEVTPSRVLYHLFLAMAEVIRVEELP